jgi:hypothetical protein
VAFLPSVEEVDHQACKQPEEKAFPVAGTGLAEQVGAAQEAQDRYKGIAVPNG